MANQSADLCANIGGKMLSPALDVDPDPQRKRRRTWPLLAKLGKQGAAALICTFAFVGLAAVLGAEVNVRGNRSSNHLRADLVRVNAEQSTTGSNGVVRAGNGTPDARLGDALISDVRQVPTFQPESAPTPEPDHPLRGKGAACFASVEFACVHERSGGVGRAFTSQAAELQQHGLPVRVLAIDDPDRSPCRAEIDPQCPISGAFAALRGQVVRIPVDIAMKIRASKAGFALLSWLQAHPRACRVLHVHDWTGLGVFVGEARRAGMLPGVHLNVQIHCTAFYIYREMMMLDSAEDLVMVAQERMAIEYADSVVALCRSNVGALPPNWKMPADVSIISNVVSKLAAPLTAKLEASTGLNKVTHIIFYGKLDFRKGLFLFMDALNLLAPEPAMRGMRISIIGPYWDAAHSIDDTINRFCSRLTRHGIVSCQVQSQMTTERVQDFFIANRRDSLVILPTYVECQSFALFDLLQTRTSFLASDIPPNRELLGQVAPSVLFKLDPMNLAVAVRNMLSASQYPLTVFDASVPSARQVIRTWQAWHKKRMKPEHVEVVAWQPVTVAVAYCESTTYLNSTVASIRSEKLRSKYFGVKLLLVSVCPLALPCHSILDRMDARLVDELRPICVSVPLEHNGAVGSARNISLAKSETDLVVLLDENELLATGILEHYVRAAAKNPAVAVFTSLTEAVSRRDVPRKAMAGGHDLMLSSLESKQAKPRTRLLVSLGAAVELFPFANMMGASGTLVRVSSPMWGAGVQFSTLTGIGCDDWEVLASAVLQQQLLLVPVRGVWSWNRSNKLQRSLQSARTPKGARPEDSVNHLARCTTRVLQGALAANGLHSLFPTLWYAASLYQNHEQARLE